VRSAFLGVLGDLLRYAGRIEEGLVAVDEGFAHAERSLEGGYIAELHRARGELLLSGGDQRGAEGDFRRAMEYAARQQAKSFELRAATALARLLASAGRTADARATLAPVYEWFTEGHATTDLTAARQVLSSLG
jgi:predicted ATPase